MRTTNKPRFNECTERATKLLCQQELLGRALSIRKLTYDRCIIFDTIQNYAAVTGFSEDQLRNTLLKDGCVLKKRGANIVLYEESTFGHWERFNWTLGHEVGHIYMDHTHHGSTEEVEAHFFTSQLFLPEYTIRQMVKKYRIIDANDLSQIFWVSVEAAKKRIRTLKKYHSQKWLPEDYQIYKRLYERIDFYFYCKKRDLNFRRALIDREVARAEREREKYEMLHFL